MPETGQTISHYRLLQELGRGGMGVVYAAEDLTLGRKVALKFLAADFHQDDQALQRFHREARSASALNHPHICTIYEADEHQGQPFIAMELLEGETLQQRLARGPVPLDQVIEIALAVTDALDAAHDKGMIHRDIKPANILLTARGPKMLDFGLAKLAARPDAGAASISIPTEAQLTDAGRMLGTPAYMSPEQVRGDALDARTDLFSLGVVLYEMTTGRPAFTGATSGVIAAAILHASPASPLSIRPDLPAMLNDIILKAVRKDREERYQTAADVRADLRRLRRETATDAAAPQPSATREATAGKGSAPGDAKVLAATTRRKWPFVAAAALVAAGAVWVSLSLVNRGERRPEGERLASLDNVEVLRLTSSGNAGMAAISPDGRYVVYMQRDDAETSLWLRQTTAPSNVRIVEPQRGEPIHGATVSPDSSVVDFVRGQFMTSGLYRVPFLGGTPRKLIDNVTSAVAWAPDGSRFAFVRGGGGEAAELITADRDGRNERVVSTRKPPATFLNLRMGPNIQLSRVAPAWSPDGKRIAVLGRSASGPDLAVLDGSTNAERSLPIDLNLTSGVTWLDSSTLVVAGQPGSGPSSHIQQLWRLSYPEGRLTRFTNDLSEYVGVSATERRDQFVTTRWQLRSGLWVGEGSGRDGSEVVPMEPDHITKHPVWIGDRLIYRTAPTGQLQLFSIRPGEKPQRFESATSLIETPNSQVRVHTTIEGLFRTEGKGGQHQRLAEGRIGQAVVTRDATHVVYLSLKEGRRTPWIVPVQGGIPRQITTAQVAGFAVSPDGARLLLRTLVDGEPALSICEIEHCVMTRPIAAGRFALPTARWTPDGRAVALVDLETRTNVWVQPLDGSPASPLTHFTDGVNVEEFAWSHDGKYLAVSRSTASSDIVLFRRSATPR